MLLAIFTVAFIACGGSSPSSNSSPASSVSRSGGSSAAPSSGGAFRIDPPADGNYVGKVVDVDPGSLFVRFSTICSVVAGSAPKPVTKEDQKTRLLNVSNPSYLVVFIKSRNEPNGGHWEPADLTKIGEAVKQDPSATWTASIIQGRLAALQQDNPPQPSCA
jgi:hypothetical protein